MSRIGKRHIDLPSGVEVTLGEGSITVKGAKGVLKRDVPTGIDISQEDGQLIVRRDSDIKEHRSLHGLTRALIANMVQGVEKGFEKKLELVGTGYRAAVQGKKLVLTVGYSHPVEFEPPEESS